MTAIRVVVADDSRTVRSRLVDALSAAEGIEVVGEAQDGEQAILLCKRLRPDVVTLDMMMPVVNGLSATEQIMGHMPTPILIVSASVNRGELFRTYDALAAGAVDVLDKPSGEEPDGTWEARFVAAVRMLARIRVITHPRARLAALSGTPTSRIIPGSGVSLRAIAIGASTGGPGAVATVLRSLPADFPLPILLVIHIGAPFGGALADWLRQLSPIPVSVARHGTPLPPIGRGQVLMAAPDRHLALVGGVVHVTDAPPRHSCRPSVDVLFETAATSLGSSLGACLLTGMGRDGAQGLLAVRQAGGETWAQDEATSVVFGMPREAIALGAAHEVLRLGDIGPALVRAARRKA